MHFAVPYRHPRHRVGYSELLTARLAHHAADRGTRLMAGVSAAGIDYTVVRVWKGGDQTFERRLHQRNGAAPLCPARSRKATLGRARHVRVPGP